MRPFDLTDSLEPPAFFFTETKSLSLKPLLTCIGGIFFIISRLIRIELTSSLAS